MTSCNSNKSKQKEDNILPRESAIGGTKDDHGCLTSAGQQWSNLKQDCIQIFVLGKRLHPMNIQKGETVYSAFVIFNEDQSKCEVFLPKSNALILIKVDDGTYIFENYRYNNDSSILYKDDKIIYRKE